MALSQKSFIRYNLKSFERTFLAGHGYRIKAMMGIKTKLKKHSLHTYRERDDLVKKHYWGHVEVKHEILKIHHYAKPFLP